MHSGRIRFTGRLSGDKKIWRSRFPSLVCYAKIARKSFLETNSRGRTLSACFFIFRACNSYTYQSAEIELSAYILGSFGEPSRLDYGTGHELSFCAFLLCCLKLNVYTSRDMYHLGVSVFPKYNSVIRKVILTYRLEPAGSRGSWGLDDYFFIPFYWGSAQLSTQDDLSPKSVCDEYLLRTNVDSYMYFASVQFVHQVKGSPLSLTAPILYDISTVPTWSKINSGLLKMYQV